MNNLQKNKQTLSDSIGEEFKIKLSDGAVGSVDHLFPDLGHFLQTWCQFLVVWYAWCCGSLSHQST